MINNIDKAVQASRIEEKKYEYYKLKNDFDSLPRRIKLAEMDYYKEGGCNLNDPDDTKRCGFEYYLEIKQEERKKALESFKNKEKENDENAEEFTNFSFFDNFKLNNLFNKKIEGMKVVGTGNDMKCNWNENTSNFKACNNDLYQNPETKATNVSPCKYNQELESLIQDEYIHRKMMEQVELQNNYNTEMNTLADKAKAYIGEGLREKERKGKVDFRHATFYDKATTDYKMGIEFMKVLYWIVFAIVVFIFIYKKIYEVDSYGYIVLLTFTLIPLLILKPFTNLIMLNVKRFHFIDTLYFTIAIITVSLISFLYLITSKNIE